MSIPSIDLRLGVDSPSRRESAAAAASGSDTDRNRDTRRQSLAFFHQPNYDAEVVPLPSCVTADRPARYERTTSGDHLFMKMTKANVVRSA